MGGVLPAGFYAATGFGMAKPWRMEQWVTFGMNPAQYPVLAYTVPKAQYLVITQAVPRIARTSVIDPALVQAAGDLDFITRGYFQFHAGEGRLFKVSATLPVAVGIGGVAGTGILNNSLGGDNSYWSLLVSPQTTLDVRVYVVNAVPAAFNGVYYGVVMTGWLVPEQYWISYLKLITQGVNRG